MKIKVPREIHLASHKYTVKFDPHMRHDEACYGQVNHRRQEINIETSVPPSTRNQTLLHEVIHVVDRVYVCRMDEDGNETGFIVGRVKAHRKMLVKSSAFLKWGGYAEMLGFPPSDLEAPIILLSGTGKPHVTVLS